MHASRITQDNTLGILYNILKDGEEHTSLELSKRCGTVCIGTRIAELRQELRRQGHILPNAEYKGESENGKRIYAYRLNGGGK